jgi:hypothetical protein
MAGFLSSLSDPNNLRAQSISGSPLVSGAPISQLLAGAPAAAAQQGVTPDQGYNMGDYKVGNYTIRPYGDNLWQVWQGDNQNGSNFDLIDGAGNYVSSHKFNYEGPNFFSDVLIPAIITMGAGAVAGPALAAGSAGAAGAGAGAAAGAGGAGVTGLGEAGLMYAGADAAAAGTLGGGASIGGGAALGAGAAGLGAAGVTGLGDAGAMYAGLDAASAGTMGGGASVAGGSALGSTAAGSGGWMDYLKNLGGNMTSGSGGFNWTDLIGPATQLAGGAMNANAAGKASDAQLQAAREAMALNEPFRLGGVAGMNRLLDLLGVSGNTGAAGYGSAAKDFGMADFQADPGYAFRQSEGEKALQRAASASGLIGSGKYLKDSMRFNQDLASQEYGNAYNRYQTNRASRLNPLQSLMGAGQTAAGTVGEYATQAGNAQAAGRVGTANAWNNAIGQGVSMYNNQQQQQQNNNMLSRILASRGY